MRAYWRDGGVHQSLLNCLLCSFEQDAFSKEGGTHPRIYIRACATNLKIEGGGQG